MDDTNYISHMKRFHHYHWPPQNLPCGLLKLILFASVITLRLFNKKEITTATGSSCFERYYYIFLCCGVCSL